MVSQETKILKRPTANPKIVLRFIEKHQPITLTTLLGTLECREVKENFDILLKSNSIHVDHEEPVPGKLETLKFYAAGPSPDKQATEDYFGGLPPPPRIDVKQFLAENPEPISTPPPPLPPPAIPEPESKSKSDEGKERVYDKNVLSWMKEVDNGQGKCVTAQQVADHFKIYRCQVLTSILRSSSRTILQAGLVTAGTSSTIRSTRTKLWERKSHQQVPRSQLKRNQRSSQRSTLQTSRSCKHQLTCAVTGSARHRHFPLMLKM